MNRRSVVQIQPWRKTHVLVVQVYPNMDLRGDHDIGSASRLTEILRRAIRGYNQ